MKGDGHLFLEADRHGNDLAWCVCVGVTLVQTMGQVGVTSKIGNTLQGRAASACELLTMASEGKRPEVFDAAEEDFVVADKFKGDDVEHIVRFLLADGAARIGGVKPDVGIVCGTGLSHLSERVQGKVTLKYTDIPRFPVSTGVLPLLPTCIYLCRCSHCGRCQW